MENKLSQLFDFQHFQQNNKLKSLIQEVEGRYHNALNDDDLELISAAGEETLHPLESPDPINPVAEADRYPTDQSKGLVILPVITQREEQ